MTPIQIFGYDLPRATAPEEQFHSGFDRECSVPRFRITERHETPVQLKVQAPIANNDAAMKAAFKVMSVVNETWGNP